MFWPGTLVGVIAGWALASIPGAMLGALLGQVLDRRLKQRTWRGLLEQLRGGPRVGDQELLFLLLGRLAKSRGRVVDAHIQQARSEMQRLQLDDKSRRQAIDAFGRGKLGGELLDVGLRQRHGQEATAEGLLQACWRMAWASGTPNAAQKNLLLQWGDSLGLSRSRVLAMSSGAEPPKPPATPRESYTGALRLLGVTAESEPEEIKRAYRKLISQNHPDKLEGMGASPERIAAATNRTREIQAAYLLVRQRRGFR
ncbi:MULTISPECIES: DnaJ domain-containing protein [Pseudomonas]|uniref:DnaJ domain-containing protein n=1 Tax=Pseudomonas TaxID=286 RepID=UPI0006D4131E|nr:MULTISPECIES: DnaJ domain-containing protein [Pseudomonas]MCE4068397.1 DnaJ domain-containing protein [Pseudomonas nitritireducens]MCE4077586.1 DnaJ domain-containing protein [Pseudomonas nitroreducens]OBY91751.1 molecular chaperone DjlA [Pseudomonas sp. AU11447]